MSENKKNKGLGLPETKGTFEVKGLVTGMRKDSCFVEKTTKTNKLWRAVNFGVNYAPDETLFVRMNGMEREEVFFSKKNEVEGQPNITKKVPWSERFSFKEEGFSLVGKKIGVEKTTNEKGQEINKNETLVEYDACKKLNDNLKDGQTVFIRGNIEYSQYNGKHQTNFSPNQVSLGKEIDFESDDFEPIGRFTQEIVFMGIKKDTNEESEYIIDAKIVGYKTIEDAEFRTKNAKLAKNLRDKVEPYTKMKTWGNIVTEKNSEQVVVEDDGWGESNAMEKQKEPMMRKLIITGVAHDSFDTTTYTKNQIEAALEKVKVNEEAREDFGSSDDGWGTVEGSNMDMSSDWD